MNKKKGSTSISLVAVSSTILFVVMLIAIILFLRGCSGPKKIGSDSLNDVKTAIERIKEVDGATETLELDIHPEHMIIAYAPNVQTLVTKYKANEIGEIKRHDSPLQKYTLDIGVEYIFPRENLEGTLQDLATTNFIGYIKGRPANCPTNNFCICECRNFFLKTEQNSDYKTDQAHIYCTMEDCVSVENINIDTTFYPNNFLSYSQNYNLNESQQAKLFPEPKNIFWEGGFIFLRTNNYNVGKSVQYICKTVGQSYHYKDEPCQVGNTLILERKLIIAGHIDSYGADLFNLKISNRAGKIHFEII